MKKRQPLAILLLLLVSIFMACTTEALPDDLTTTNTTVTGGNSEASSGETTSNEGTTSNEETSSNDETDTETDGPCFSTTLVAGQHYEAGTVSVDIEDGNLIITYSSNGDWEIGISHLSVGYCDEDWVPLNGAGNPIIGQFDFTEPFSQTPYEVVYVISIDDLDLDRPICFAAHAEVEGPTGGETAWAEGEPFDGNSWAMFVSTTLTDCDEPGGGNNGPF